MVKPADLSILHYPAPALRERARSIHHVDEEVKAVAARMIELMHEAGGVGLAAPQIGLPWRLFVTDVPDEGGPKVYVNPALTAPSVERATAEEGCLSLPGIHVDVQRPVQVTLTALDLDARPITQTSNGFAARVWQHEFDHLNGVLIIDRLSAEQRQVHRQTLKELKAAAAMGGKAL